MVTKEGRTERGVCSVASLMAQVGQRGWFRDVALRGIDFGPGRWHRWGIEGRPRRFAEGRRGAAAAAASSSLTATVDSSKASDPRGCL